MKINEFLKANNLTSAAFAERIGVSEKAVNNWRQGARVPRWDLLAKIHDVTNGAVTANDFLQPDASTNEINTHDPSRLSLVGVVPATKDDERELHRLLRSARIRGEWFRSSHLLVSHFLSMLPAPMKGIAVKSKSACTNPAKVAIERLGGIGAVAAATGVHQSRVYRWMASKEAGGADGIIPLRHISTLLALAREKGVQLAHADFFPADAMPPADHREAIAAKP
eukprot:gene20171-20725_t